MGQWLFTFEIEAQWQEWRSDGLSSLYDFPDMEVGSGQERIPGFDYESQ